MQEVKVYPVLSILDISRVNAKVSVPEKEIINIKSELTAHIEIPVLWDKVYEAKLSERNIVSSPITRTYEVKFTLDKTPIFLTSMTTAVGVVPMILSGSSLWEPMGVVYSSRHWYPLSSS